MAITAASDASAAKTKTSWAAAFVTPAESFAAVQGHPCPLLKP